MFAAPNRNGDQTQKVQDVKKSLDEPCSDEDASTDFDAAYNQFKAGKAKTQPQLLPVKAPQPAKVSPKPDPKSSPAKPVAVANPPKGKDGGIGDVVSKVVDTVASLLPILKAPESGGHSKPKNGSDSGSQNHHHHHHHHKRHSGSSEEVPLCQLGPDGGVIHPEPHHGHHGKTSCATNVAINCIVSLYSEYSICTSIYFILAT